MLSRPNLVSSHYLISAIRKRDLETVISLLKQGVDNINDDTITEGKSALVIAIEQGSYDITEQLIKHGACLDSVCDAGLYDGCYPLHVAAFSQNCAIVKLLLKCGADLHARDAQGETPLFWFVLNHYHDIFKGQQFRETFEKLLAEGADINAKNKYGHTIFHNVAMNARVGEVGELLLRHGANIESRSNNGRTPLHMSVNKRGSDLVHILELGVDVNCKNDCGQTPLHQAVLCRTRKDIILLLEYGADVNLENYEKETPFEKYNNEHLFEEEIEIRQIFIRHVAKLLAVNTYVSEKNIQILHCSQVNTEFYNRCVEEIQDMKIKKVHDTDITFFDLLTKHLHMLSMYASNENVAQLYESEPNKELKAAFPIYSDALNNHLYRAMIRRELVDKCAKILWISSNKLSRNNLETICSYLTLRDLKNFISAYRHEIHDFQNRRLDEEVAKAILPVSRV